MQNINLLDYLKNSCNEILDRNPTANIVVVGPSTLDKDPSLLCLSEMLSNTKANLTAIEFPKSKCYSDIDLLKRQIEEECRKDKSLNRPKFIETSIYSLENTLDQDSVEMIYDHASFYWSVISYRNSNEFSVEGCNRLARIYKKLCSPAGRIIITETFNSFEEGAWKDGIIDSLKKCRLDIEYFRIKDVSPKFTEVNHYHCKTMAVASKPL